MKFTFLTYNLLYNKATSELGEVLKRHKPDILCFQEIVTDDKTFNLIEKHGYKLADYSNFIVRFGKIFGVATFYKPEVFSFTASSSLNLPRAFLEILLYVFKIRLDPRIVLKTEFIAKKNKKRVCVYNVHLTPYSTNAMRAKQINNIFPDFELNKETPTVVAGDFNFPYRRKAFEALFQKYDLKEATNTIYRTFEKRILRFFLLSYKTDYILYKNLKVISTKKLLYYRSDHYPLLSKFEL